MLAIPFHINVNRTPLFIPFLLSAVVCMNLSMHPSTTKHLIPSSKLHLPWNPSYHSCSKCLFFITLNSFYHVWALFLLEEEEDDTVEKKKKKKRGKWGGRSGRKRWPKKLEKEQEEELKERWKKMKDVSEVSEGTLLRKSMKKATFSKSWKFRMFGG